MKKLKIGEEDTPVEISTSEVRVKGTINADAVTALSTSKLLKAAVDPLKTIFFQFGIPFTMVGYSLEPTSLSGQ